jgi:hypothetical protein
MHDGWVRLLFVTALGLSSASLPPPAAHAVDGGVADVEIVPPHPSPDDHVSIRIHGDWPDSCAPANLQPSIAGNEIRVDTSFVSPSCVCLTVLTPFEQTVSVGPLPAGAYHVSVRYTLLGSGGPCAPAREIGTADFDVGQAAPLDHFKCYRVDGEGVRARVDVEDRFESEDGVTVLRPRLLCAPVDKNGEGFATPQGADGPHLLCYEVRHPSAQPRFPRQRVVIENQFGSRAVRVIERSGLLCVPSRTASGLLCASNIECGARDFCAKGAGECAGAGVCRARPQACTQEFNPVVGCDGRCYNNACHAAMNGVSVLRSEPSCPPQPPGP